MVALAALAIVLILAAILFLSGRERPYDRSFDARVAHPAYAAEGPIVLYDQAHHNTHTADGAYKPFADMIRSDGYRLDVLREPVSAQSLSGASVLAIVCARGANATNDSAAFTEPEAIAIADWVRDGGSLLFVTDHWPFGSAAESLARRLGVQMGKGLVEDPEHHHAELGASHLVFAGDNGLLRDHPITRGRNESERIRRVLTFTGQSILGPPGAITFMALSDSAREYPAGPGRVEKAGGNVRVHMEYGAAVPAKGRAQGIALELGKGRIVVLGESGMLRAYRDRNGSPVGMNVPGYDNRQLGLNIMHWLSRGL